MNLFQVATNVHNCTKCELCKTRNNVVFGVGNPDADLMFIGEGPGANEDKTGEPFVGRAGKMLDRMITSMGLAREYVYITNIVKCRPPNNRNPLAVEVQACMPYLVEQIRLIQPRLICTLGAQATKAVFQTDESIGEVRGKFRSTIFGDIIPSIPVMPTYHPAYLMRAPQQKIKARQDLQDIVRKLKLLNKEHENA